LVANGERVFLSVLFFGTDSLRMEGLDPLPIDAYDTWMLSYDLNGGNPQAVEVYDHGTASGTGMPVPGPNALVLSPDGQRMAGWVGFRSALVAGTDTAFSHVWSPAPSTGPKDHGLIFGALDCLLPGLPTTEEPPEAFFAPPAGYCAGQSIPFADASLFGPTAWSWSFPGGEPATSTDPAPVVTYTAPGTYAVTLIATNANGESTPYTAEVLVDICTGLAPTIADAAWQAWPVPTADVLQVRGPHAAPAWLLDLQGRQVWSGTLAPSGTIDLQGLTSGSYVLVVEGARLRVVKE
jgi:hypothetical protein